MRESTYRLVLNQSFCFQPLVPLSLAQVSFLLARTSFLERQVRFLIALSSAQVPKLQTFLVPTLYSSFLLQADPQAPGGVNPAQQLRYPLH